MIVETQPLKETQTATMDTDLLAKLIDRKRHVLSQLSQLTIRQLTTVRQGDMSHLLGLLAAKKHSLNELQAVERELDPFRHQDPDSRRWQSPAHRERAREVAEQCETLLQGIMRLEKQSETELVHRRDSVASRLQGVHGASQATKAYATHRPRHGDQLDISSEI